MYDSKQKYDHNIVSPSNLSNQKKIEDCQVIIDMLLQRFQEETDKGPRKQKILQDFDNEQLVKAVSFLFNEHDPLRIDSILFKSNISKHDIVNTVYQTPVQVEYISKENIETLWKEATTLVLPSKHIPEPVKSRLLNSREY